MLRKLLGLSIIFTCMTLTLSNGYASPQFSCPRTPVVKMKFKNPFTGVLGCYTADEIRAMTIALEQQDKRQVCPVGRVTFRNPLTGFQACYTHDEIQRLQY